MVCKCESGRIVVREEEDREERIIDRDDGCGTDDKNDSCAGHNTIRYSSAKSGAIPARPSLPNENTEHKNGGTCTAHNGVHDRLEIQCAQALESIKQLLLQKCNKCPQTLPSFASLREHYKEAHALVLCMLCQNNKKLFSSEYEAFAPRELAVHNRYGDRNVGFKGHVYCPFCKEYCYDERSAHKHAIKQHFLCTLCDANGLRNRFYRDSKDLQMHSYNLHYTCFLCRNNLYFYRGEVIVHLGEVHGIRKRMEEIAVKKDSTVYFDPYAERGVKRSSRIVNRDGGVDDRTSRSDNSARTGRNGNVVKTGRSDSSARMGRGDDLDRTNGNGNGNAVNNGSTRGSNRTDSCANSSNTSSFAPHHGSASANKFKSYFYEGTDGKKINLEFVEHNTKNKVKKGEIDRIENDVAFPSFGTDGQGSGTCDGPEYLNLSIIRNERMNEHRKMQSIQKIVKGAKSREVYNIVNEYEHRKMSIRECYDSMCMLVSKREAFLVLDTLIKMGLMDRDERKAFECIKKECEFPCFKKGEDKSGTAGVVKKDREVKMKFMVLNLKGGKKKDAG